MSDQKIDEHRKALLDSGFSTTLSSQIDKNGVPAWYRLVSTNFSRSRTRRQLDGHAQHFDDYNTLLPLFRSVSQALPVSISCDLSFYEGITKQDEPLAVEQHKYRDEVPSDVVGYDTYSWMMSQGWNFSDSWSSQGWGAATPQRHISFSSWSWHGRKSGSPVGFFTFADAENFDERVSKLANSCLKAWRDYPESIPYQNAYGEIKEDLFKTRILFGKD